MLIFFFTKRYVYIITLLICFLIKKKIIFKSYASLTDKGIVFLSRSWNCFPPLNLETHKKHNT